MSRALFTLHADLPREGPGSDAETRAALQALPRLPDSPRVVDLGCGPGRQSLVLAAELRARVFAVDLHAPFLERLRAEAHAAGLGQLVETVRADFARHVAAPGSVDLLWSEGAAWVLGFGRALAAWRSMMRPGGLAAVSECTWWTDEPPAEARAFWAAAYPDMGTEASNGAAAARAGWELLGTRRLPDGAWWEEYYVPLRARIDRLRPLAEDDRDLARVLDDAEREIALFERCADAYGYAFYLLRAR